MTIVQKSQPMHSPPSHHDLCSVRGPFGEAVLFPSCLFFFSLLYMVSPRYPSCPHHHGPYNAFFCCQDDGAPPPPSPLHRRHSRVVVYDYTGGSALHISTQEQLQKEEYSSIHLGMRQSLLIVTFHWYTHFRSRTSP